MGKKNLARLIPVKKHIVRPTQSGGMSDAEVTYYKKPKESPPGREKGSAEPTPLETTKKVETPAAPEKEKSKVRLLPSKSPEKEAENVAKPESEEVTAPKKVDSSKIRIRDTDHLKETRKMMDGIESFDDFKSIGVDPKAAEIFFCRM